MASFQRNAGNAEDFYLIVGFQVGSKDNIVDIKTLEVNGSEWHNLIFPTIEFTVGPKSLSKKVN